MEARAGKDNAARKMENSNYWRERRYDTYSKILSALMDWGKTIRRVADLLRSGKVVGEDKIELLTKYWNKYDEYFNTIELLTERSDVNFVMIEGLEAYTSFTDRLLNREYPRDLQGEEFADDRFADAVGYVTDNFTAAMRSDLKISSSGPIYVNPYSNLPYGEKDLSGLSPS